MESHNNGNNNKQRKQHQNKIINIAIDKMSNHKYRATSIRRPIDLSCASPWYKDWLFQIDVHTQYVTRVCSDILRRRLSHTRCSRGEGPVQSLQAKMARVAVIFYLSCLSFGTSQDTTSVMNFEKFFRMEEELLTLSDLIVKQELRSHDEDVHQFANITRSVYAYS